MNVNKQEIVMITKRLTILEHPQEKKTIIFSYKTCMDRAEEMDNGVSRKELEREPLVAVGHLDKCSANTTHETLPKDNIYVSYLQIRTLTWKCSPNTTNTNMDLLIDAIESVDTRGQMVETSFVRCNCCLLMFDLDR
jgi:hypothetical protein